MTTTQQLLAAAQTIDANSANADIIGGLLPAAFNGASAKTTRIGDKNRTVIALAAFHVPLADNAGVVAFGSKKLIDFPKGQIRIDAVVADVALTKSSAGVIATWNGDFGVGTVAANNTNTLSTTEQDIVATTSTPAGVAGVSSAKAINSTPQIIDNTAATKSAFFNLLVDDTDHDVTTTPCDLILTGNVTITWENLGV